MYFLTPILILATLTALTHALPPQKGPFGQSTADFYLPNLRLPWGPKYWSCIPDRLPCSEDKNCCSSNCACFEISCIIVSIVRWWWGEGRVLTVSELGKTEAWYVGVVAALLHIRSGSEGGFVHGKMRSEKLWAD
ncbi:hypothetical protein COCC4DRAFT_60295 [Bipolaris maydis ATCC 48331]|uniref:WAP domain-containing protein n=2 Tax=Cochliobolus heterostrophus TaxID=5016 RepID=M2UB27_COCH5|nr:uncharacterized protein COCC4DRAFT_60295 [Bipolaris maydis ATCC 48331]EMD90886.1 hypothetical protein COCHEDRAFT_1030663 [Bipolaris maydis C5]ENI06029.1 hypothetical protein COCC4DRAFT_60295 [Bipolaris maydis ATCC 48331]KAJ6205311.1 hypothetical protein PSV09DRAFT_1030663 [Bipolaris maydis]